MAGEVTIISRTQRKINGNYYARVRYKIDDGKPLDILRHVENKSAIKPKQAEIEVELLKNGPHNSLPAKLPSDSLLNMPKTTSTYLPFTTSGDENKGVRSVVPAHAASRIWSPSSEHRYRKINEKKLTDYQVARLTGTIKIRGRLVFHR